MCAHILIEYLIADRGRHRKERRKESAVTFDVARRVTYIDFLRPRLRKRVKAWLQTFSVLVCMKNGCLRLQSVHFNNPYNFETNGSTRTELRDAAPQTQETVHRSGPGVARHTRSTSDDVYLYTASATRWLCFNPMTDETKQTQSLC